MKSFKFKKLKNVSELTTKVILQRRNTESNFSKTIPLSVSTPLIDHSCCDKLTKQGMEIISNHEIHNLYAIQETDITQEGNKLQFNYNLIGF